MEKYYHYTCTYHLPAILESGYLKKTQGILKDQVVWLTKSEQVKQYWQGEVGSEVLVDKSAIRFTVIDTNIITWENYKNKPTNRDTAGKRTWIKLLEKHCDYDNWGVSENIIPLRNVISIENTITGKRIDLKFNALKQKLTGDEIENIINELT